MKFRIAILGIGLLAGAAALNAQSRPGYVGSSTPGDHSSNRGPIKVSSVDFNDAQDQGSSIRVRPTFFGSSTPDDIQQPAQDFDIAVFPIPAVDILNIEIVNPIPDEFIRVYLFDSQGNRVPAHQERSGYLIQLEIGQLPAGRYTVEVVTNTQQASRVIEIL